MPAGHILIALDPLDLPPLAMKRHPRAVLARALPSTFCAALACGGANQNAASPDSNGGIPLAMSSACPGARGAPAAPTAPLPAGAPSASTATPKTPAPRGMPMAVTDGDAEVSTTVSYVGGKLRIGGTAELGIPPDA